jgi:O-antigen ligase
MKHDASLKRTYRLLLAPCSAMLGYALLRGGGLASDDWLLAGLGFLPLAALAGPHRVRSALQRSGPLFALLACLAIQLLPWPVHSVAPWLTLAQLVRVLAYMAIFLALRESAAANLGSEWSLLAIPLAFGCAEAIFGVAQHLIRGEDNYAVGTFADHSHFAGFMELLLPLAICWAVSRRRLVAWAPAALFFVALLHSFSRMGLFASILAIAAMVLFRTRRPVIAGAAAVGSIALALMFAPNGLWERFQRISTYEGFRNDAHLARWHDTLRLIATRPAFGSGAGTYEIAFASHNTSSPPQDAQHADNDYLQLMAETGIVGTLATLALLAFALRRCVEAGAWNLAALGCASSIIAMLAHSVFEFQMYVPANVLTLAWIAGVGCGLANRSHEIRPQQTHKKRVPEWKDWVPERS